MPGRNIQPLRKILHQSCVLLPLATRGCCCATGLKSHMLGKNFTNTSKSHFLGPILCNETECDPQIRHAGCGCVDLSTPTRVLPNEVLSSIQAGLLQQLAHTMAPFLTPNLAGTAWLRPHQRNRKKTMVVKPSCRQNKVPVILHGYFRTNAKGQVSIHLDLNSFTTSSAQSSAESWARVRWHQSLFF